MGQGYTIDWDELRRLADDLDEVAGQLEALDSTVDSETATYIGAGGREPSLHAAHLNHPPNLSYDELNPLPALEDLSGNWTETRGLLVQDIESLAGQLRGAADRYEEVDVSLAFDFESPPATPVTVDPSNLTG